MVTLSSRPTTHRLPNPPRRGEGAAQCLGRFTATQAAQALCFLGSRQKGAGKREK